jgi:hypothetical protein
MVEGAKTLLTRERYDSKVRLLKSRLCHVLPQTCAADDGSLTTNSILSQVYFIFSTCLFSLESLYFLFFKPSTPVSNTALSALLILPIIDFVLYAETRVSTLFTGVNFTSEAAAA